MIAALLGIPLWITVTYLILPWLHETTPLTYGVATTLLVFLALEFRAIALGGLVNQKSVRPPSPSPSPSPPDQRG